ncbi:hypothetical protein RQ228_06065 [Streptococcus pneumoniae]|uniref:Uncharacterized protein n=1 Tax=Streptococcus pneumoniae TaxID=1313 RepID=A0A4J2CWP1_STREE|nr:hypothetical protein [Streptococcus pneumoniae]MDS5353503.1 hypothetical protein [Streptococcus pneumoniae]MDS5375592.1 hypothetical protein [Streptococcus pneumoniae]MDS8815568.1 hypothetical protein [Streptococcus pneumoniae]MDT5820915.1 hypothetical protein [Streptococcus pneumoniae]
MRPCKYPYSGRRKRQKVSSPIFSARPIFNEVPIVEEVKVEFGVEASMGRIYPETLKKAKALSTSAIISNNIIISQRR